MQSPMEAQEVNEVEGYGRWIVHLRMDKIEGEEQSPFDLVSRTVQSVNFRDSLYPDGPLRSDNEDGVIWFYNPDDIEEEGILERGKLVREALGQYASKIHLFYKTKESWVNRKHSDYRLSKQGVFSKYKPEENPRWRPIRSIFPDETDLQDHSGIWILKFPRKPDVAEKQKKQAYAMLLAAHNSDKVELWNKSGVDGCSLACITDDDRNLEDIYSQGMVIRRVLKDLSDNVELYYKKRRTIQQGFTDAVKCDKKYDYRLSHFYTFYRVSTTGVGEVWIPIPTAEFK